MSDWKEYRSHRVVRAAPIEQIWVDIADNTVASVQVDGRNYWVPNVLAMLEKADIGDYAVEYDDGYRSICPKAQFEAGYTEVQS